MTANQHMHSTSKDNKVEDEVKQIKKFLLKSGVIVLVYMIVITVITSLVVYFFWDQEKYISKFWASVFIGSASLIYVIYYYFKPMFLVFDKPKGIELENNTPLFKIVNDLATKINAPKIKQIFLVSDLNAYVSSYRTWSNPNKKHYLSIGLQMLSAINTEELKSIVAHELAHISKDHAGFSNFIYRIYVGLHHFECDFMMKGGGEDELENSFYGKFVRKLDDMSYSIKRDNEFQADELAAKFTSPEDTASALCRIYYTSNWLDENYWDKVWKNSWKYPAPPKGVIKSACQKIMQSSTADLSGNYDKVKITRTKKGDTHPSLKDRVKHLNTPLKLPKKIKQKNLAIFTLGKQLKPYLDKIDKEWMEDNLYRWQSYHQYMSDSIMRRDLLIKTQTTRELLNGEKFELARLEEIVGTTKNALKRYYDTYLHEKRNISALYETTRLMLKTNPDKAESILIKLMQKCPIIRYKGACLLSQYYDELNNKEKVDHFEKMIKEALKVLEIRKKSPKKNIMKHGLSDKELNDVVKWLEYFGDIYWAMLFQLKPEKGGWQDYPNYILIVSSDKYFYEGEGIRLLDGLHLNGTVQLIDEEDDDEQFADHVEEYYKEGIIMGASYFSD